jgi:hypothetical protein
MKIILPSNKTSKNALSLLIITVTAFLLVFYTLALEPHNVPLYGVAHAYAQPSAPSVTVAANRQGVEGQIRQIAEEWDFPYQDYLVRLAKCESGLNPKALGDGMFKSRGIFQISKFYHPNISDECAYDVECATKFTIEKINAGQQGLWSCDRII